MNYQSPSLSDILARFDGLRQAPTGDGKRMPHKPLLILLMLGRVQRGDFQPVKFEVIRPELEEMLQRFGPPSPPNAVDPFWRLQNDEAGKIWQVRNSLGGRVAESVTPPGIRQLEESGACGVFAPALQKAFQSHANYISCLAAKILGENFPESLHEDITTAVGLDLRGTSIPEAAPESKSVRDPGFRSRVLTAYEYRCAITGWDLRIGLQSAGIEAAHIRWHVAGGPSEERNGIALNSLHHKLFDLGVFTLTDDEALPRILVSRMAHGGDGVADFLMRFHRQPIRAPQDPAWLPEPEFIRWHRREVFKGEARV